MKIEKKNLVLEDFLKGLDLNNLEKDMMFSDLEDDDEDQSKQSSAEKPPVNEEDNTNSKSTMVKRKKSVMNYAL